MPRPWDHGMQAWTYEPAAAGGNFTPSAGVLYLARIYIRPGSPVFPANIGVYVTTGGTGATVLANCFLGLYDVNGNKLASSDTADQSTPFSTTGFKSAAMTAAQRLTPGANYWVALVVGTQSTTNVVLAHATPPTNLLNANLVNTTARGGSQLTGLTALPASIAPGSTALANPMWACVL